MSHGYTYILNIHCDFSDVNKDNKFYLFYTIHTAKNCNFKFFMKSNIIYIRIQRIKIDVLPYKI